MNSDFTLRQAELSLCNPSCLKGAKGPGKSPDRTGKRDGGGPRGRFLWIDRIRGLTLVSMIGYHLCWDLHHLFGVRIPLMGTAFSHIWQQSICWSFILLSGYCLSLGRKTWRHAAVLLLCALTIRAVTSVIEPDETVRYGVLFLLGASSLIADLLREPLENLPPRAGLTLALLVFFLTYDLRQGYLGYEAVHLLRMPPQLYRMPALAWLGFPNRTFHSGDYFPLFPWFFLFLAGFFLYRLCPPAAAARSQARGGILAFLGRHSLLIYMLHQPLLYGLCLLLLN